MSKTFKRLTVCGMALMMSGIINVGSSAIKNNNIEAQASRIHRGLKRNNHRVNHANNRIKGLYKAFRKMGMNNEHAVALIDLIAFQDPSMNNNTTNTRKHLYGFYQQSEVLVKYEAMSEHKPMSSLTVQTNALFSSPKNLKAFKHHKGSITNLTYFLFHKYFDPLTKKKVNYNQPLSHVIKVTNQNWIKIPIAKAPAHKIEKTMIIREVKDNQQQNRQHQKVHHKVVDTTNISPKQTVQPSNWHYRDGTGGISEAVPSDGEISWRAGQVPSDVIPYIHNPKDVDMDLGTGTGWSDPGGECVNFANSYFTAIWGINKPYVMGNGIDMADNWNQELNGGNESSTPHAGAIASTSQDALTGGNPAGHTFVVEHVFKNGDILVAEENWPSESGDDNGTPNTWNYAVFSKSLMSQNTKFYMPNTHKYHLNWNGNN